jgi:hypothetical protein
MLKLPAGETGQAAAIHTDLAFMDPRLIFLERAAAKLHLVEACYQDLDTAFADLVPAFRRITVPPCQCERKILDSFDGYDRKRRRQRRRKTRAA